MPFSESDTQRMVSAEVQRRMLQTPYQPSPYQSTPYQPSPYSSSSYPPSTFNLYYPRSFYAQSLLFSSLGQFPSSSSPSSSSSAAPPLRSPRDQSAAAPSSGFQRSAPAAPAPAPAVVNPAAEAWAILHEPAHCIDPPRLQELILSFGVTSGADLMMLQSHEVDEIALTLKTIPQRKFLQNLQ